MAKVLGLCFIRQKGPILQRVAWINPKIMSNVCLQVFLGGKKWFSSNGVDLHAA